MHCIRYSLEVVEPLGTPISRKQLDVGHYRIGRGAECEICADLRGVSREHAALTVLASGGCVLRDLDSTNGTRVDGRRIAEVALSGDFVLELGSLRLRFREHGDELSGLAFQTGLTASDAEGVEHSQPGTQVLSLSQRLRDAAWQALPDASSQLGPALSSVLANWLGLLDAKTLRMRSKDGTVLAAAGDQSEPLTCLSESAELQFEMDTAAAAHQPLLGPVLAGLLPWLATASVSTGKPSSTPRPLPGVATANAGLRRLLDGLQRVARSRVGILLLGETGVGKEVLARWVHECSPRSAGPFVAINCAALPRDLLEAELFGIEKGAATGVEARPGVFERAHGGTLFLDELGDMPAETQVRLLRALEDGRIHRIGGKQMIEADVRLVGATNRDLEHEIAEQRFRLDLYHRIAGFEARIPPLRERPEDIAPLAIHFYTRALSENGIASPGISAAALGCLQAWLWPGNVRELRQAIESASAMLQDGEILDRLHLPPRLAAIEPRPLPAPLIHADAGRTAPRALADAVAEAERVALLDAVASTDGDPEKAWQLLGIGKTTFYKKLKEHGIGRAELERESGE